MRLKLEMVYNMLSSNIDLPRSGGIWTEAKLKMISELYQFNKAPKSQLTMNTDSSISAASCSLVLEDW